MTPPHQPLSAFQELGLSGYLKLYAMEWFSQPATPYIDLPGFHTNPAYYAAIGRAPYAELPPADIALLAADPALRARYCELAITVLLPPLRRMSEIIGTKHHLKESVAPTRLDPLLPGIGRDWTFVYGTLSTLYFDMRVYAAQFESLTGRWEEERYDKLQPDSPGQHFAMLFLMTEQMKDVAKKEVELVGMSSGSRSAAGGIDFMKGGVAPADAQTVET
jgi:hypothetical protein